MASNNEVEQLNSTVVEVTRITKKASEVLSIPELLELILCHVADWPFFKLRSARSVKDPDSLIDMYHCGLVCKFWRSMIDTSPAISRKLCKYNGGQPIPPIDYHKTPFGSRVPTFVREGEVYPTINYSFISWLAWRVPRCFEDQNIYDIRNLHAQYVKDNFPPTYFSKPPTTEVLLEFTRLKCGIAFNKCGPHILVLCIDRASNDLYPSQTFTIKNERGVTVEDIVRALCSLMDPRRGEHSFDPDSLRSSNRFLELKIGIFKRTEQGGKGGSNRWSSLTRYGSFVTLPRDGKEPLMYEVWNKFKLFGEIKRARARLVV
ncbi:hypothetical protein TWF718_003426 [Orbilia javanica]|uniref:F-box domain-containing protein n=1 Tax=Orbilia javanica TaxID=47235 RepID=A0AAN8R913_9PEZI